MKNSRKIILFMITMLIFTGCFKKNKDVLTCSDKSNKVSFNFKDDKVIKVSVKTIDELSSEEEAKKTIELFKKITEGTKSEGVKIELSTNGKKITAKYTYTIEKLTEQEKLDLLSSGIPYDKNYDEIEKEFLKKDNYECE